MEQWTEVRRQVLTGELSKRAACREYDLSWQTLAKMLTRVESLGKEEQVVCQARLGGVLKHYERIAA